MLKDAYVFINCPFDKEYSLLLRASVFTVRVLGLHPQLALNSPDCSNTRFEKICGLIKTSRYSIHDISRMNAKKGELARMNMPFELGLDIGMKYSGIPDFAQKRMLIVEQTKYQYQKALSDLAGFDIHAHENDLSKLIEIIRDWLVENKATTIRIGPKEIWNRLCDFNFVLYSERQRQGYSNENEKNEMPINETLELLDNWMVMKTQ